MSGALVLPFDRASLLVSVVEPVVIPVNFVLADESIVFRVEATFRTARAVGALVAFEVDQIDESGRAGWSVVV